MFAYENSVIEVRSSVEALVSWILVLGDGSVSCMSWIVCESGGFRVWGIGLVGVELGLMFYEGECVGMEMVNG